MNAQMKRRLFVVSGIIVVVLAIVLAIVASSTGYQTISVAQALEQEKRETRVQVTGQVVDNSYRIDGDILSFDIYDPEGDPKEQLSVRYEGSVSATFGNQVTAICTGKINTDGVLECSELVTKCPSKYESATDALSVSQVLNYGESIIGKPLKITGLVESGSLNSVGQGERLVLVDEVSEHVVIPVYFDGAISDAIEDATVLVVTGSLDSEGNFNATIIALREE